MKTQFFTVLFLFAFGVAATRLQAQQILTITTSAAATPANYDDIMARLDANGLTNVGWTFHAIGAGQPTGLFSIGLYPSQDALNARLEKVRPVYQAAGGNLPAPQVFEVYRTFTGNIPATKPAAGILVFFDTKMTQAQYEQTITGLRQAGIPTPPPGQLFHVAYKTPEGIKVVDVWDSIERFQNFGNTLIPVLQAAGVTPPQPVIYSLHNYVVPN